MKPLISVVIPTKNRFRLLVALLESLWRQDAPLSAFEVIVSDNGSMDGTREWLSERDGNGLVALFVDKPGAAPARNAGLRVARGERVLFLDDDMEASFDLIRCHLEAHGRDSGASYLGHIVFPWNDHPDMLLRYLAMIYAPTLFPFPDGAQVPFMHYYTAHVSSPRAAIERAGGFDESLGAYGYEDIDLGYRLEKLGIPMRFLALAKTVNRDVPVPDVYWEKIRRAGYSKAAMLDKHPELVKVFQRAHLNKTLGPVLDVVHLLTKPALEAVLCQLKSRKGVPLSARALMGFEIKHLQSLGWRDYWRQHHQRKSYRGNSSHLA
jgi:glycosyltransferase involved in cell wall biosynthesis